MLVPLFPLLTKVVKPEKSYIAYNAYVRKWQIGGQKRKGQNVPDFPACLPLPMATLCVRAEPFTSSHGKASYG